MIHMAFVLISIILGFVVGSIVGALSLGVPGITFGGILVAWVVLFMLGHRDRRAQQKAGK